MKLKMLLGMLVASILYVQSIHSCQEVSLKDSMALRSSQLNDETYDVHDALNNRNYEVLITETGRINKKAIFAPERLGAISVHHDDSEFRVESQDGSHAVRSYFVDKELRGISKENLAKLIAAGSYLSVNKMEGKNEYALRINHRLNGGGAGGAIFGAFLGKALVSIVGHGAIQLVAVGAGAVTTCIGAGPSGYFVVSTALESTLGPAIEAASVKGAIAGGIAGSVASGPV